MLFFFHNMGVALSMMHPPEGGPLYPLAFPHGNRVPPLVFLFLPFPFRHRFFSIFYRFHFPECFPLSPPPTREVRACRRSFLFLTGLCSQPRRHSFFFPGSFFAAGPTRPSHQCYTPAGTSPYVHSFTGVSSHLFFVFIYWRHSSGILMFFFQMSLPYCTSVFF